MKVVKLAAMAVLLLAACGGDEEDPASRPDAGSTDRPDASRPRADAAPDDRCDPAFPDDCSGETICIGDSCESAFGRTYQLYVYNLDVATQNPEGTAWDPSGGAPDPYVAIYLNGDLILTTSADQDTFAPELPESTEVVIPAGARLEFDAWDDDLSDPDLIVGCVVETVSAEMLRYYGPVCTGTAATGTEGTVLDLALIPKG